MKKLFSILALLCLSAALLCACSKKSAGGSDLLPGVWVNAGQYSEGRDFVETLTVNADGTLRVHLDYQGGLRRSGRDLGRKRENADLHDVGRDRPRL